jgi:hypothetical protein
MLKPHHLHAMAARANIQSAHNEIEKGNQTIQNLSNELNKARRKINEMKPFYDAMKIIRNFEETNPYWTVTCQILQSASQRWIPNHKNEVVNPHSDPERWKLNLEGKRNHNLYMIALAAHLYNVKSAPRNAIEWTNWLLTNSDKIPEDSLDEAVDALTAMNDKVKYYSSNPTASLTEDTMLRFNELKKAVTYEKNSTVPQINSIPNHNEDRELEKIIGVQPGQKKVPTTKIDECPEWEIIHTLFKV